MKVDLSNLVLQTRLQVLLSHVTKQDIKDLSPGKRAPEWAIKTEHVLSDPLKAILVVCDQQELLYKQKLNAYQHLGPLDEKFTHLTELSKVKMENELVVEYFRLGFIGQYGSHYPLKKMMGFGSTFEIWVGPESLRSPSDFSTGPERSVFRR